MELSPLLYKVAPFSTNESGPSPMLVLLHGRGTDENDLLGLVPAFDPRLLIVSIQAPYRFPYGGYTWFDLDDTGAVNINQLLKSQNALISCIDEIQQNYLIDPRRIFLFGFSMGAMMSLTVSLSHPNRFTCVIAHSGFLPQHKLLLYQWDNLGKTSFFIEHGTNDPIVPVELGRQAHQRLVQANAHVRYREYPIQHAISEESLNDASVWLQQHL
jgi:phospholipase/carboxylesterase